jgi:chorismate mutase
MMKDDSPTPEVPQDGISFDTSAQADWPLEQIKELARELYIRFPFDDEDHPEGWKDLVREAFIVFENLDEACEEILKERSEDRKATARQKDAHNKLTSVAPFDKAVRYITGEKRTDRAESKFKKVLSYEARIVPWEGRVRSNLPAKEERRIEAQLKKWRQSGIRFLEAVRLQSLFERNWPNVLAEQNSTKRRKNKRRRGKRPVVERRLQMPLVLMSELDKQRQKRS